MLVSGFSRSRVGSIQQAGHETKVPYQTGGNLEASPPSLNRPLYLLANTFSAMRGLQGCGSGIRFNAVAHENSAQRRDARPQLGYAGL
jgi:hypothetical protein